MIFPRTDKSIEVPKVFDNGPQGQASGQSPQFYELRRPVAVFMQYYLRLMLYAPQSLVSLFRDLLSAVVRISVAILALHNGNKE